MADIDLRQSVLEELDFDPSFDAANIGVAVENGVVTLTGHVRSYAAKLAVERAGICGIFGRTSGKEDCDQQQRVADEPVTPSGQTNAWSIRR